MFKSLFFLFIIFSNENGFICHIYFYNSIIYFNVYIVTWQEHLREGNWLLLPNLKSKALLYNYGMVLILLLK